jgi:hypothetical protein
MVGMLGSGPERRPEASGNRDPTPSEAGPLRVKLKTVFINNLVFNENGFQFQYRSRGPASPE